MNKNLARDPGYIRVVEPALQRRVLPHGERVRPHAEFPAHLLEVAIRQLEVSDLCRLADVSELAAVIHPPDVVHGFPLVDQKARSLHGVVNLGVLIVDRILPYGELALLPTRQALVQAHLSPQTANS